MIPANIEIKIDEAEIQKQLQKKLDEAIQAQLWFVDLDKLAQLTNMSKRWLEEEILNDPRMRLIERRRSRKRWWPAQEAFETIITITAEW